MKRIKIKVGLHIDMQGKTVVNIQSSKKNKTTPNNTDSFYNFMEKEIEYTNSVGQQSTSRNYRTALNSLHKFYGKKELLFNDLTPHLIYAYEQWLKRNGVCLNTISCYMRSLRAIYNKAILQNIATDKTHPFQYVFTGVEHTSKRSIQKESIINTLSICHFFKINR